MNWIPLNLTIGVDCHLVYETTVQTPVLFMLKPLFEGRVLVMQERLLFGIGLPLYEFQKATATTTHRFQSLSGAICQMRWIPSGIPLDTFWDTAQENTGPDWSLFRKNSCGESVAGQ